jgi:hypothetical protein
MSIDSEAVFDERARELGLSVEELERIRSKSWNTMGKFAFSCGYAPGGLDDVQLRKLASFVSDSGANDPPDDRFPIICRLYLESYTMVSKALRSRVVRRDDDTPRRLPNPERAVRHRQQASWLANAREIMFSAVPVANTLLSLVMLASIFGVSSGAQMTEKDIPPRGAEVCQQSNESNFNASRWVIPMFALLIYVLWHVGRDTGLLVQWMRRRGLRSRAREPEPEPEAAGAPAAVEAVARAVVINTVYTPMSAGSVTHLFADCASMTQHPRTIRTATRNRVCRHCQRALRLRQTNG